MVVRSCALLEFVLLFAAAGCAVQNNWATPPVADGDGDGDGDGDADGDGDGDGDGDSDPPGPVGLPSCFEPGFEVEPGDAGGDGADVGQACDVAADCRAPLVCVAGVCAAPGASGAWCDGIDVMCPNDGTECVGFLCVFPGGGCAQNVDCPSGYECVEGACAPAGGAECVTGSDCPGGSICDFGVCVPTAQCAITNDLRGAWTAQSVLHLDEAASGVVGAILEASEWIRDLLQGRGGIPGTVGDLVNEPIRDWIETNLYQYQIDAIVALGDVSDLLDEVQVDHSMSLDAACREAYRGTLTFDRVAVEFRGELIDDRPEAIPEIGVIEPAEFGARLHCDSLSIDEFRVDHLVAGLIRWVTDVAIQHGSDGAYDHVEEALLDVVDCAAIGQAIGGTLGDTTAVACEVALAESVDEIQEALDETALGLGLMRLEGEAEVPDDDHLDDGHWSGSLIGGDFTGEFTATRN